MKTQPRAMVSRLAVATIAVLALAACTQKSAAGSDAPEVPSAPSTSSSPVSSSVPASTHSAAPSTRPRSSSAPPTSRPPSTSAGSTPAPTPTPTIEAGGCPTAALTVRALRGSGAAGQQFAFLQFTNNSSTPCSLTGYPGVQLLLAGRPLGSPATRSGKPTTTVHLASGASGTAGIIVDSSCNASISDSVQVFPPNRTDRLVLKLALRGCAARVDPITGN